MSGAEKRACEIHGDVPHLKGDTHVHATSATAEPRKPTEAIEWYDSHGYDFVVITDHRRMVDGLKECSTPRLIVVPGMELNGPDPQVREFHMVGIGLNSMREMPPDCTAQQAIDAIHADGGLAIMAHPFWLDHTPEELLRLRGLDGLEVYNHAQQLKVGKGLSVQLWHQMLMADRMLLGTAGTDAHFPHPELGAPLAGGAWIVVECAERSVESIMASIRRGHFYASSGPTIESCRIEDGEIRVRCSPATAIHVIANRNWGMSFNAPPGEHLTEASYQLGSKRGPEKFVRVEVHDGQGGVAWTNPMFLGDYYAEQGLTSA